MAELIHAFKRGDDVVFPTVVFRRGGSPVDLTVDGVTVACHLRPTAESSVFVAPSFVQEDLAEGRITMTLARSVTRTMEPRIWCGDIEVVLEDGARSSETFNVNVVADLTWLED